MRLDNLSRSTPFRLALTFGLLFVFCFVICGVVMYHMLRIGLATQMDSRLTEMNSVIASTYDAADLEDLVATLNSYANMRSTKDGVYSLMTHDGHRMAGNFSAPPTLIVGTRTLPRDALGLKGAGRYRVQVTQLGANTLVVGESFADTDGLLKIILVSLGWAAVLSIAAALAGGLFIAARVQVRLDAVASTMLDISNGRLDARIPLLGAKDDLDMVALRINDALGRLSSLVEGMRQVSTDIAHELKTPLNRLGMTLDEAMARHEAGASIEAGLVEARVELDRINATFEALLRISQIEAGARRSRFQPVDLAALLHLIAETYTDVVEDNGQRLIFDRNCAATVRGDRELLTQMVVNLVENAITHCPVGTVIEMKLEASAGVAVVVISDNGPGIPENEREKVFHRLYRLDKSRTTPGSGLGLALVRAIADLHNASIQVKDGSPGLSISVRLQA